MNPRIETCTTASVDDWVALRLALWPESDATSRAEAMAMLADPDAAVAYLARTASGAACGFAEATLRREPADGSVAFLEGVYVRPSDRRQGLAGLLCRAIEAWATSRGCHALASDVELRNGPSHRLHASLGYAETERVVCYRKRLVG